MNDKHIECKRDRCESGREKEREVMVNIHGWVNCQYALLLLVLLLLRTNKQNASTVCTVRVNVYVGTVHVLVLSMVRWFVRSFVHLHEYGESDRDTDIKYTDFVIVFIYLLMCCYSLSSAWLEWWVSTTSTVSWFQAIWAYTLMCSLCFVII